ncbi:12772_t:CDS:2 [Acaulospora morrowiae]|uniref:12772_t:CDS:1 n=1 Tax=Acaulospora morrowiae TaxID=94023 RepID=A0A9N9B9Y9_9GLOM|nr:12772_t:CDS:2 [Acaulospora morrowiae]
MRQNVNAQRRHRAEETEEQRHTRNFSENTNNDNHSIPHKIHSNNYSHCSYCNMLKFLNKNPGMCCRNGKDDISKLFHDNIRIYNSAFAFASVGIHFDHELANAGAGVYTFRV